MDVDVKLKKISKQHQNSWIAKEKDPPAQGDQTLNYRGRLKVKNRGSSSGCDHKFELRPDSKSLLNHQGQCLSGNTEKDDELVKYMSKLPDYLQRLDGVNFQGNALNVGVLDWSRLENWKDKQRTSPEKAAKSTSSSSRRWTINTTMPSCSSAVQNETSSCQSDLHSSNSRACSFDRGSSSQSVKPSTQKLTHIQDFQNAPKLKADRQKKTTKTSRSFDKKFVDGMLKKDNREDQGQELSSKREISRSNRRGRGVSHLQEKSMRSQNKKRVQELQESGSTKVDGKTSLISGGSTSDSNNHEGLPISENRANVGRSETNKIQKELQDSNISLGHGTGEPKNIVLLFPKHSRQSSLPEVLQHSEPGKVPSKDWRGCENSIVERANQESIGCSSHKPRSAEILNEIPKPSRPPIRVGSETKNNARKNKTSSDVFSEYLYSSEMSAILPDDIPEEKHRLDLNPERFYSFRDKTDREFEFYKKPASSRVNENLEMLDRETAELAANRDNNPSQYRRFSFNMPRLSRSFSFKEFSAVPQLSSSYVSAKSGPARSGASAHLDTAKADKDRAKSSPFRRLLDPLRRSKGTAESVQLSKGNVDLNRNSGRSHTKEKDKESEIQAIVTLTIRNGLPFYKFVVDNDSNVLAATMKSLRVPGKDDSGQNYTFYSINEIKKKGGSLLGRGSKGKDLRYVYNVIGQMKISSNSTSELVSEKATIMESVLFDTDLGQADNELPKLFPNRELAAVVVKFPSAVVSDDTQQTEEDKDFSTKRCLECFPGEGCLCNLGGADVFSDTTVILPGAIHSLPDKGKPSPLISRWKSGGSCDCGGWDVGCKLCVLSNEKNRRKSPGIPKAGSVPNLCELFDQGVVQQKGPAFRLAPRGDGTYSVRFNASISLLQAFFICIAVVSNQKLSGVSDFCNCAEANVPEPNVSATDKKKNPIAKYVSPPHSPVGRV